MKKKLLPILLIFPFLVFAQQKKDAFRSKALMVKRFMELNHYRPLQWNDSASILLYNKWILQIDKEKLFFTQKDIISLADFKNRLDEEMNGKGWLFFNTSTNLLSVGIKKADSIVNSFLSQPIDFSKPENTEWPYKNFAANNIELVKYWQRYLKWQLLDKISNHYLSKGIKLTSLLPADF